MPYVGVELRWLVCQMTANVEIAVVAVVGVVPVFNL